MRAATILLLGLSSACRSSVPPPPALRAAVAQPLEARPSYVRQSVRAVLRRGDGRTELQGVLVTGPTAARMQLFPDVGAKVLDLWVGAEGLVSRTAGPLAEWQGTPELRKGPDDLPSSEIEAFAYTAYRVAQPLRPEELSSVERTDEGWRAEIDKLAGLDVEAELAEGGEVRAYRFSRFGASWRVLRSERGTWTLRNKEVVVEIGLGQVEPLEPTLRVTLEPPS